MTEHESLEDGSPMLGPDGGMLFETSVVDVDDESGLRWGGPKIEAQTWHHARKKAEEWSHDRIAGFIIGCGAGVRDGGEAVSFVHRAELEGRAFRLCVDGVLYEEIPA